LAASGSPALADPAFRAWLEVLRPEAETAGVSRATFDTAFRGLEPDLTLPDLLLPGREQKADSRGQSEFTSPPAKYLDTSNLARLAADGRALAAKHKTALERIEREIGVDRYSILAIWGRETAFGSHRSRHDVIRVLATQAYTGRRPDLFRGELVFALRLLQEGIVARNDMRGSWAGAMGLTQFMPSEYFTLAYDLDGDGKKDIWHSVPDALASLANNLAHIGWDRTQPWGIEVRAPKTIDCSLGYLDIRKAVGDWAAMGIAPLKGDAFPPQASSWQASLLQPAGVYGPAFLTFQNFQAIREYNKSDLYALFVGDLADRIRGGGGFERKWDPAMQIPTADVEYMQKQLTALGLYSDTVDGKAGGRTRSAAGAYQKRVSMPQTCWPTRELIAHLKAQERSAPAR
jgi:lytic murein transglycosylase